MYVYINSVRGIHNNGTVTRNTFIATRTLYLVISVTTRGRGRDNKRDRRKKEGRGEESGRGREGEIERRGGRRGGVVLSKCMYSFIHARFVSSTANNSWMRVSLA